jgi:hypothetical protein
MSKETLAIATAAMEENEVLASFYLFRPERKHSLVIYLAYLLLACSWAKEEEWSLSLITAYITNPPQAKSSTRNYFNFSSLAL